MDKSLKYKLGVHRAMGLTYLRYQVLKDHFQDDWSAVWNAGINQLTEARLDARGIEKFLATRSAVDLEKLFYSLKNIGAEVLEIESADYPEALRQIPSPPVQLFVRGSLKIADFPSVSVVGSRRMTSYGKAVIQEVITPLVRNQITIVSGLAYGVDFAAHQSSVAGGGRTIGVLGCGIDQIYPKQHAGWVEQSLSHGQLVLISEHLPGVQARPEYFPQRNRIVAGLSLATIVVEAAPKSGSLITAKLAHDYNREVLAVPGSIMENSSQGCNQILASQIAHPACSGIQVLEYLGLEQREGKKSQDMSVLSSLSKQILQCFATQKQCHIDDIVSQTGAAQSCVSSELLVLELSGWIRNTGDQNYARV